MPTTTPVRRRAPDLREAHLGLVGHPHPPRAKSKRLVPCAATKQPDGNGHQGGEAGKAEPNPTWTL